MTTVQNIEQDGAGTPLVAATVEITLVTGTAGMPGYTTTGAVVAPVSIKTSSAGVWSASLIPNTSITPANTHYRVLVDGRFSSTIVVPAAGGPYNLSQVLQTPPPAPSSLAIAASTVTTKGDLLVGTGPASVVRLGVGSDGAVLVADSAQPTGLAWSSANSAVLGTLYNVESYGAVGDGVTDDFPAVQAAWNAMLASTSPGRVFFPRAVVYRCVVTSAVVVGAGGQYAALPLPARVTDNSHPKLSYGILGVGEAYSTREYPGSGQTTAKNTTSSVILVDYTGSFSWSGSHGHPSFIGTPDADFGGNFTNLHFSVDHITMRQPDNPSLCGINLETAVTARVEDFAADLNTTLDTSSEPTHPTGCPLLMPKTGNAVNVAIRQFSAWGYYAGYPITEHCDGDSIEVVACKIGAFIRRANFAHGSQIKWFSMEEVPWGITGYDPSQAAGANNNGGVVACPAWLLQLLFWDVEDFDRNNTAPWMYPGSANDKKAHVYDPNNVLKGWCHYMRVDSGANAGDFETAYVTGANNFGIYQLASRDSAVTRLQGGNPSLITYATDTFNRANSSTTLGTSSGGQAWTALNGTWGIKSNAGYLVSDGTGSYNVAVLNGTNGLVTYTLDLTPKHGAVDIGLAANVSDVDNLIFWDFSGQADGTTNGVATRLFKRTGGSFSGLTSAVNITMNGPTTYSLKMVIGATSIGCYINNSLIFSSSGATGYETNTKFGIVMATSQADAATVFDNLLITSS